MGSANFPKAWAIIGSLTRSADYLQLTTEPEDQAPRSFMHPLALLPDACSPVEEEERRRVFWNIFLMDRFISVTSGWNTGLIAQDVHRRLPCNKSMWIRGELAVTPFFGMLDKLTAEVGSLISYKTARNNGQSQYSRKQPPKPLDTLNVGAQAFLIEATESLSQVKSFFLRQEVNFESREDVSQWLAGFKELDLRLVQ